MTTSTLDDQLEQIRQLDNITSEASEFFNVPYAMINLVTSHKVIFKSCTGLTAGDSLESDGAFCSEASKQDEPLVISDASQDSFFKTNPLVTGSLHIRSYAGKSLYSADGKRIGTLCLLDTVPREYTENQLKSLTDRAKLASVRLNALLST